jgi:hypothetical protein
VRRVASMLILEEEVLDYAKGSLEGPKIWSSLIIYTPKDTLDPRRTSHLGSILLEEEIFAIIGEMAHALSDHHAREGDLTKKGVTRLNGVSPQILKCRKGISTKKFDGSDLEDSWALNCRTNKYREISKLNDISIIAFILDNICIDLETPCYNSEQRNGRYSESGFISDILEYRHMSGSPTPTPKNLGLQNLEGGRKHKFHQRVKKLQDPVNIFLGEKIKINEILEMLDLGLVGQCFYFR